MARSRARKARRKARQEAYSRNLQRGKYSIQEDKDQKQDALDFSVSGGHFESNRRKH